MSKIKTVQFRIGISGWTFPPWRGVFYPKGLPQKQELHYASRQVNSIEINGTFYSLQRPSSYQNWYDQTPDDFVFSVKGNQFITHRRRLKDVQQPLANFLASGILNLKQKLGPILWQLPPSLKFDAERIEEFCKLLPRDTKSAAVMAKDHHELAKDMTMVEIDQNRPMRYAMEVRHESFATSEFIDILRKYNVALVIADTAGKWPYGEDISADFIYTRLHGDEEIYTSGYTDESIEKWARRLKIWSTGKEPDDARHWSKANPKNLGQRDVFVYFDNDVKVKSPTDAMALARRLGENARGMEIKGKLPPPAAMLSKKALAERVRSHWPTKQKRTK